MIRKNLITHTKKSPKEKLEGADDINMIHSLPWPSKASFNIPAVSKQTHEQAQGNLLAKLMQNSTVIWKVRSEWAARTPAK